MRKIVPYLSILVIGVVLLAGATGIAEGNTSIQQVTAENGTETDTIAVGDTMVVQGSTNLQPDDNAIIVDLENEDGDIIATASTDQWGQDGIWSVSISTTDLSPGEYTLVADDGKDSDVTIINIVHQTPTPPPTTTPTETPTSTPTKTSTPTPTSTAQSTPTPMPTASPTPSATQSNGPAFTLFSTGLILAGMLILILLHQ
jgi:hypothetical protein